MEFLCKTVYDILTSLSYMKMLIVKSICSFHFILSSSIHWNGFFFIFLLFQLLMSFHSHNACRFFGYILLSNDVFYWLLSKASYLKHVCKWIISTKQFSTFSHDICESYDNHCIFFFGHCSLSESFSLSITSSLNKILTKMPSIKHVRGWSSQQMGIFEVYY